MGVAWCERGRLTTRCSSSVRSVTVVTLMVVNVEAPAGGATDMVVMRIVVNLLH